MLYHGHGLDSWRWGDGWDEGVAYVSSAVEEALCGADGARYAFDVKIYAGQPFLCNRRLFAMADVGIPDGIKCDVNGNVYSGCGWGFGNGLRPVNSRRHAIRRLLHSAAQSA